MNELFMNPTISTLVISSISFYLLGIISAQIALYKKRRELNLEHQDYLRKREVEGTQSKNSIVKAKELTDLFIKQKEHNITVKEIQDLEMMLSPVSLRENNETRHIKKIIKAETEYYERLWIIRHQVFKALNKSGNLETEESIYKGALEAEQMILKKYGKEDLLNVDEFDVGMISGKLSALRWVLGDPWDELWT